MRKRGKVLLDDSRAVFSQIFPFRRLRVIILPPEAEATAASTDQTTLRETAMRPFAEADAIEREPGKPRSDLHEKACRAISAILSLPLITTWSAFSVAKSRKAISPGFRV